MAFMVGLRFRLWLIAIFAVSGSRSIVIAMAPPACITRWGLSMMSILPLATRLSGGVVVPSAYVALAVSACIRILV